MHIPLSRTADRFRFAAKGALFDGCNLEEVVATRRQRALEDSMGFRGQWDEHRRFQITTLKEHGLLPSHTFLEIGCGPLTGGIPVIQYLDPGHYTGIDIRPSVLNLSWTEIGNAGLSEKNPRLICSTTFGNHELADAARFDFILSFSVLYHLTDELLHEYFQQVSLRLSAGAVCFANINTTLDESTWLQFPFRKRTVADYTNVAAESGLQTRSIGTIQSLGFRLPGAERLNELLEFRSA